MYNQYQQNQPPFSMASPQCQYVDYSRGIPFHLPIRCGQYTRGLEGQAAHELINYIQSKSVSSGLRMFMFNQLGANGFNNSDFMALLQDVMDTTEQQAFQYRQAPNAILQEIAMRYVDSINLLNVERFNLFNFLPPDMLRNIQTDINHAREVIRSMLAQPQAPQQSFTPAPGYNAPPVYDPYATQVAAHNSRNFTSYNSMPPPVQNGYPQTGSQPASAGLRPRITVAGEAKPQQVQPYNGPTQPANPAYEAAMRSPTSRMQVVGQSGVDSAGVTPQRTVINPPTPQPQKQYTLPSCMNLDISEADKTARQMILAAVLKSQPGIEVADVVSWKDPGVKFRPTEHWRVVPIFDARIDTLYYIVETSGVMRPIIIAAIEEFDVDMNQHLGNLQTSYVHRLTTKTNPEVVQQQALLDMIMQDLDAQEAFVTDIKIYHANEHVVDPQQEEEMTAMRQRTYPVCSLGQGWLIAEHTAAQMNEQASQEEKICATQVQACVVDAVVDWADPHYLGALARADDFTTVRNMLTTQLNLLDAGSDKAKLGSKTIRKIDERLADVINHVLKNVIGVDIEISSFLDPEGGGALMKFLKDHQPSVCALMVDYQAEIIAAAIDHIRDPQEVRKVLYNLYCEQKDDGQDPKAVLFVSHYKLINLDFESSVLFKGLVNPAELSHVDSVKSPLMHKLFTKLRVNMGATDQLVIRMSDGIALHVSQGILEDSPLAMRVQTQEELKR